MKTIFKKLEGREWDWFGRKNIKNHFNFIEHFYDDKFRLSYGEGQWERPIVFSLADLLANKSWCKAVWGKWDTTKFGDTAPSKKGDERNSLQAFQILQQEGEEACIEYILRTMI